MNRIPYHLRPNKAADRFTFIEAIRRLESLNHLNEYTYHGLGGPFLEDMRLLYENFPDLKLISIERNEEIYKCQEFHRICCEPHLSLNKGDLKSYINEYEPEDRKSIFWLDYTNLELNHFRDFITLLKKVVENSMVKITLCSVSGDYWSSDVTTQVEKADKFREKFSGIMPNPLADPPREFEKFAFLLQQMLQVCAVQAFPADISPITFQPVSSFIYSDGTAMFTLTGIVCKRDHVPNVKEAYSGWKFANLDWLPPTSINIPILTTKERLYLQEFLPCSPPEGKTLSDKLGYLIADNVLMSENSLEQYAKFHRHTPYFMRGIP